MSSLLTKLYGRAFVLHEATLRLCQDSVSPYETTAFLERLVYYQGLKEAAGEEQWVYNTREVWCRDMYFSERQLRNAIAFLKDDLEILAVESRLIPYQGRAATVAHYQVDIPRLEALLKDITFLPQDPNEDPPVKLTVPERRQKAKAKQGGSGQIDRPGSDELTIPGVDKTSDAYIRNRETTESHTERGIPAPSLRSVAGAAGKRKVASPEMIAKAREMGALKEVKVEAAPETPKVEAPRKLTIAEKAALRQQELAAKQASAPEANSKPVIGPTEADHQAPSIPPAAKKSKAKKEPKTPYTVQVLTPMKDAIALACYPAGGIIAKQWKTIQENAVLLLDAGYAPDDIPLVAKMLSTERWAQNGITPYMLADGAPRWKAAQAKRRKRTPVDPAPQSVTAEQQADLAELAAHFAANPFSDL